MKQPKTYYDFKTCRKRVQVHQGGTRSGKTYSILQGLCELCWNNVNSGMIITVVRRTYPSLRGSVLRDFIEILQSQGLYEEKYHNKTESLYDLFGNTWEFIAVEQESRIRGRKRHVVYINEANELSRDMFMQLALRTTWKIILDYNPSMEYHWIYDDVIPRDDCAFFQTTYKDNPYLSEDTIAEIERLKETDDNYWRIYGLGEKGISKETIFQTHTYTALPENTKTIAYGLDFGYASDPAALILVHARGDELYIEQKLYSGGLTNQDLAHEFKKLGITRHQEIIADSAEPKSITELHRMNFNVKPAKKGADSIRNGIDIMRRHKLYVKDDSIDVQKEFRNYKWMTDKDGRILPTPKDEWNHAIDAIRYVCLNKLAHRNRTYYLR